MSESQQSNFNHLASVRSSKRTEIWGNPESSTNLTDGEHWYRLTSRPHTQKIASDLARGIVNLSPVEARQVDGETLVFSRGVTELKKGMVLENEQVTSLTADIVTNAFLFSETDHNIHIFHRVGGTNIVDWAHNVAIDKNLPTLIDFGFARFPYVKEYDESYFDVVWNKLHDEHHSAKTGFNVTVPVINLCMSKLRTALDAYQGKDGLERLRPIVEFRNSNLPTLDDYPDETVLLDVWHIQYIDPETAQQNLLANIRMCLAFLDTKLQEIQK